MIYIWQGKWHLDFQPNIAIVCWAMIILTPSWGICIFGGKYVTSRHSNSFLALVTYSVLKSRDYMNCITNIHAGELAQMVERSLSMWEVPGSIPGFSNFSYRLKLLLILLITSKPRCMLSETYMPEEGYVDTKKFVTRNIPDINAI